jgi:hypothetical protein
LQPADRAFERRQRLEAGVGALYDVTREEHGGDTLGDGTIDGGCEGCLGSEGAGLDAVLGDAGGDAGRASAEMDVSDGEERRATDGRTRC